MQKGPMKSRLLANVGKRLGQSKFVDVYSQFTPLSPLVLLHAYYAMPLDFVEPGDRADIYRLM